MKFTINVCRILLIANSPLPGGVKELAPPLPIKSSGNFEVFYEVTVCSKTVIMNILVWSDRDFKPAPVVGMETENPFPLQNKL